jgi:hypothetical protein
LSLSDRCQDSDVCLNLCCFLISAEGDAAIECGLKVMNSLSLNEVDADDIFNTESIEIISKLFRSSRQMSGIIEFSGISVDVVRVSRTSYSRIRRSFPPYNGSSPQKTKVLRLSSAFDCSLRARGAVEPDDT